MIKNIFDRFRSSIIFRLPIVVYWFAAVWLQYYILEMSYRTMDMCLFTPVKYQLIGVATIMVVDIIVMLIVKNLRLSAIISSVLISVLSYVNYYVAIFHGTPMTLSMLKNTKTALNVISTYRFEIDPPVVKITILVILEFIIIFLFIGKKVKVKRIASLAAAAAVAVVMYYSYFSANPMIEKGIVAWQWREATRHVGFVPCMVQNTRSEIAGITEPDTYDEDELIEFLDNYSYDNGGSNTPDVILILNETLYDLNQITTVDPDKDPFEHINSLENSIRGYAVCPAVFGGTNKSEYEYITSNSLYLAPSITPFNTLDLQNADSVVKFMEKRGYTTLAAHCADKVNYNRSVAYPALGFDSYYFADDFKNKEYYKSRIHATDESVYKNIIDWYENMGDSPRFIYTLTIQNHAEYTSLNDDEKLVHTYNDYGDLTAEVDEYLTCVKLSDNAFKMLTEYFENADREVIICMVGDHAPNIAKSLADKAYSKEELDLRLRSVPYVIWSNKINLSEQEVPERISMMYVVPTALENAGMNLSGYYEYLCNMRNIVPVVMTDRYYTSDGSKYLYSDESEYTDIISRYFDLEYASIDKKDFIEDFFE